MQKSCENKSCTRSVVTDSGKGTFVKFYAPWYYFQLIWNLDFFLKGFIHYCFKNRVSDAKNKILSFGISFVSANTGADIANRLLLFGKNLPRSLRTAKFNFLNF